MLGNNYYLCWLIVGVFACGCASDREQVALENQLRLQEDSIRRLTEQVETTKRQLAAQDLELLALRASGTSSGVTLASGTTSRNPTPETEVAWGSVVDISIHELTSGILTSEDGRSIANIVIQPLDQEGEIVKVAGELSVQVIGVEGNVETGSKLGGQEFSITQSRDLWARGLISSGFHVDIPIDRTATEISDLDEVRVTATLKLGPDRIYSDTVVIGVD